MKGSRLELTELPEEWAQFCRRRFPFLKPEEIWEEFFNYWTALPGARATKLDWFRTWQNRVNEIGQRQLAAQMKRSGGQTYSNSPPRTYSESAPLPPKQPDSPAYREFRDRLQRFRETAPRVSHPRFIPFGESSGFTQIADALPSEIAEVEDESKREWEAERAAMQQQDKPIA